TNRGDQAHIVFEELVRRFKDEEDVILGAGSIIDPGTTSLYIQLGANFVVSPVLNPEMARVCNRRKVAYSPGCGSVNDISQAEELGVEICKIFPGSQIGGAGFVKAVRGPMPWSRIIPTGGVSPTEENIRGWIEAGAACVGMGSKLITKEYVAAGNYEGITENVVKVLAWIREARGGKSPIM
ncbi:MAG: bifunctional 4-hydroxy-2-oxoglutarate aldolase/2-dehydro-3-deoxy-phosphogluconate aldolase, partial [Candidatus Neomarinimicrobiota bacterium]